MTLRECMEAEETAKPMRSDASGDAICTDPLCCYCHAPYKPRKPWQKFCSPKCRGAFHATQPDGGLRGVVKSVRILKHGDISITMRFGVEERDAALKLEPGKVAEIL